MSKACTKCCEKKFISDFHSGYNICKTCRNSERSKTKRSISKENIQKDVKAMMEQLQKLQSIMLEDPISIEERCARMEAGLKDALRINKQTFEGISMELKLAIPDELHEYLVKIKSGSRGGFASLETAIVYLTEPKFEIGFESHFDISREALKPHTDLLRNIIILVGFVGAAYYGLMDGYLDKRNSKFINTSEHVDDHQLRRDIAIRFDPSTDSIEAYGNPLKLDREEFLAGLKMLVDTNHVTVSGYIYGGHYEKLLQLLV